MEVEALIQAAAEIDAQASLHSTSSGDSSPLIAKAPKKAKNYPCSACEKRFASPRDVKRHMKRIHSAERKHVCSTCGKAYTRSDELKSHKRSHTGEKPFQCAYCDYCSAQKVNLRHHIAQHHGHKEYQCARCGKEFARKIDFQRHETIHSSVKPFQCTRCDKSYARRDWLAAHLDKEHNGGHSTERTDSSA